MHNSTLSQGAVDAIAAGYHGDPFAVLGPHLYEDGLVIRAFLPQAQDAAIWLTSDQIVPMSRIPNSDLFEVVLPDRTLPLTYLLRITLPDGNQILYEDPYAFPSQYSAADDTLLTGGLEWRIFDKLGAHMIEVNGSKGVQFAVWAPNAERVSVVGEFNEWDGRRHVMRFHANSGIWEIFVPGLIEGTLYKYEIKTHYMGYVVTKTDPVGFFHEQRPKTASIVWDIDQYNWNDESWMAEREKHQALDAPISIYELHLSSWRHKNGWEWLTYEELARDLVPYVKWMGYTHIELMPVAEYPFDGSWGYQVTGFYAPTSRFGTPNDFMVFVDACHQAGIGVILDWVPAHFPKDEHGLGFFDGTHLYEHADPRQGAHPDWGTYIFNYGRDEVSQFLISNALFWLDKYHIDGLRVDAVASMLYLDFSREQGEWLPNRFGGRENLEAIEFIKGFNNNVHQHFQGVVTFAEESTSWPGVTEITEEGGLGFDYKWNMGWMHDSLQYFSNDPIHRAYHHGTLTFSLLYAFSEKFVLPFSHDEVVHLKKSMLSKMPGDDWQQFANLRLLYGYQWSHPGKKLQFMGGEFGQWQEWSEERSLDWHLLDGDPKHRSLQDFVRTLNEFYKSEPALHQQDYSWEGFSWIDLRDSHRSILAYARHTPDKKSTVLVICNFTPVVRDNFRLGVPEAGLYEEILNSDATEYGGSNVLNDEQESQPIAWHNQEQSILITLPPLSATFWKIKS